MGVTVLGVLVWAAAFLAVATGVIRLYFSVWHVVVALPPILAFLIPALCWKRRKLAAYTHALAPLLALAGLMVGYSLNGFRSTKWNAGWACLAIWILVGLVVAGLCWLYRRKHLWW
jgi:hypothetical protein